VIAKQTGRSGCLRRAARLRELNDCRVRCYQQRQFDEALRIFRQRRSCAENIKERLTAQSLLRISGGQSRRYWRSVACAWMQCG
jgi:hypothetical protein